MAYQMAATAVTLNDLEGHSSVACLFKCIPSNICAAFYTISTDGVLARFLCISRASCSNRVVNTWNSLPNWVVSAYTTDTFKARLDKFWHSQVLYMILEHNCRELEVVVKCCMRNFSNLVYCKVISTCGHRGFGLRL